MPTKVRKSDLIRQVVQERFIRPRIDAGDLTLSVKVKDVIEAMGNDEYPRGRTPEICQVLRGKRLLEENGLEIEAVDGPPSLQSRSVVVHYRVMQGTKVALPQLPVETPSQRAFRLTEAVRGLLKEEIAAFGGTDAFMRWVRSDEEDAA